MRLDDFGANAVLPSALVPEGASHPGFGKQHFLCEQQEMIF